MKKYLITWYGASDFRASIRMGSSKGPILCALQANEFTDLIILGFTHPDKLDIPENSLHAELDDFQCINHPADRDIFDYYSNSNEAHRHFIKWLEDELINACQKINIHFKAVNLKHLHDTEGIYEAASHALSEVGATKIKKHVSIYLSPGTPIMAFAWALAALKHPDLEKHLIASSEMGKPPQEVFLPQEWLDWQGRKVPSWDTDINQFDAVFHLFGEQRMPILLGIKQFSSKKHIFISTEQFPPTIMKQFLGKSEYCEVHVNPYDPENIRYQILELINTMPGDAKIGFNLTGGTKLMYAGALDACRMANATPFYFDNTSNQVIFLNDFKRVDTKLITSVDTFIQLHANNIFISHHGHWHDIPGVTQQDRENLINERWKSRNIKPIFHRNLEKFEKCVQKDSTCNGKQTHVLILKNNEVKIHINGKQFEYLKWPSFNVFIEGVWLEEYTYLKLQQLVKEGLITDIRTNLVISFKDLEAAKNTVELKKPKDTAFQSCYQELDIVFTDGRRLYIIECKTGKLDSDIVTKLQNVVRSMGGLDAKGFLVTNTTDVSLVTAKRINETRNITLVSPKKIVDEIRRIITH